MTPAGGDPASARGHVLVDAVHGLAAWIAPLAVSFLATPVIVGSLGADGYAIYALAVAYAAAAAAFGPGRGIVHELAGETDAGRRGEIVVNGYLAAALMGVVAAALFGLLVPGLSSLAGQAVSVSASGPMSLAVVSAVPASMFAASLAMCQGLRRFDLMAAITAGHASTLAAGSAGMAWLGLGADGVMTWYVAMTSISAGVSMVVVRSTTGFRWARPAHAVAIATRLARFSAATVAAQLCLAVWIVAERAIVTVVLGPVAATAWVVALLLGAYLQQAVVSVAQVLVPALMHSGSETSRQELYRRATVLASIVAVAGAAGIAGAGHAFLSLWMDAEIAGQAAPVLLPLALAFAINGVCVIMWFRNESRGQPERNATVAAGWTAIGLAVLWWLIPSWRLLGAGVARLAAQGVTPIYILRGERAGGGAGAPWRKLLCWVAPAGIVLGVALARILERVPLAWWTFVPVCGVCLGAYLAIVWWSPVLTPTDRGAISAWMANRVRRR